MITEIEKLTALTSKPSPARGHASLHRALHITFINIDNSLVQLISSSVNPLLIAKELQHASAVVSNLIYLFDAGRLQQPVAAFNGFRQRLVQLHIQLQEYSKTYSEDASKIVELIPVSQIINVVLDIEAALIAAFGNTSLLNLLGKHIAALKSAGVIPFHRWIWWSYFVHNANTVAAQNDIEQAEHNLINILVRLNFNAPGFISFLTAVMHKQLQDAGTLSAKISLLKNELAGYTMLQHTEKLAFFPALPPVKKTMLKMLCIEYKLLFIHGHTAVKASAGAPYNQDKLSTSLSVAQVALLLRLLLDVQIVTADNQLAFLRLAASAIKTTRTTAVSMESLRSKFYAPDHAAVSIVKDYLVAMLNSVRKYN